MPEVLALDFQTKLAEAIPDGTQAFIRVTDPFPAEVRLAGCTTRIRVEDEVMLATDLTDVTPDPTGGYFQIPVVRGDSYTVPVAHTLNGSGGQPRPVDAVVTPDGIAALVTAQQNNKLWLPAGVVSQVPSRESGLGGMVPESGRIYGAGLHVVRKGQIVTHVAFMSENTALSGGTHQWFVMIDALTHLPIMLTTNDTSAAWGQNTIKALPLTSPWTAPKDTLVTAGVCQVATTRASLRCSPSGRTEQHIRAPASAWRSNANTYTDPASCPADFSVVYQNTETSILWSELRGTP